MATFSLSTRFMRLGKEEYGHELGESLRIEVAMWLQYRGPMCLQ